jgi:hypothetical protein
VAAKSRFPHQAFNLAFTVKIDVAPFDRETSLSHRCAPRPKARERHDRFVGADFPHALQHRKRIADVIEEANAETDVKLLIGLVVEQIGLQKRATVGELLSLARLLDSR